MAENDALIRALQAKNKAGDLDAIPVAPPEDDSTWMQRLGSFLKQGAFGEAQPGQRGTWVPSKIGEDGKPEIAVPGVIQQPAESLQSLMTAPLSDIVRRGDRDAIRAASEASFDVAGALPAAGSMIGAAAKKAKPSPTQSLAPAPYPLDHVYERAPVQLDWKGPKNMYGQENFPGKFRPAVRNAEMASDLASVSRGFDERPGMPRPANDRFIRRDGSSFYSNPDDPTTAAILALLSQQQQGAQQQ